MLGTSLRPSSSLGKPQDDTEEANLAEAPVPATADHGGARGVSVQVGGRFDEWSQLEGILPAEVSHGEAVESHLDGVAVVHVVAIGQELGDGF